MQLINKETALREEITKLTEDISQRTIKIDMLEKSERDLQATLATELVKAR